jgi:hypothetical protein
MASGVVDPSLELQQLAVEALNYQAATQHILPLSPDNPSDDKFVCPFPNCQRQYKRKDLLKRHLTTLLTSPDESHQDNLIWEHIRQTGMITVYSRPRNLTEEQKKQRRKESNLRHRVKYSEQLKEKRTKRRRSQKLLEGKQIGVQTPDWEAEAKANAGTGLAAHK